MPRLNGHGSAAAQSGARYLAPNPPVADPRKAPQVKGALKVGSVLTASTGKWSGGKPTGYVLGMAKPLRGLVA